MKDKFTAGFIAGVIGAIPMNAMSLFNFYVTHLAKLRYLDFAGFMIFGTMPQSAPEIILSQIVQIGFCGISGAGFAYFLQIVSGKNYWFKGILWSTGTWFIIYALMVIFKVPVISRPDFSTAMWQYISTTVFGLVMAYSYVRIEGKTVLETHADSGLTRGHHFVPQPARKINRDRIRHKNGVRLVKPYKIK